MKISAEFPSVVLGSRNAKKCGEIAALLEPWGIELVSVSRFDVADVIEDGDSFGANARKKAAEVAGKISRWVLAEDSGLCVDALKGAPGIYSARWAGEPCNDGNNNARLMQELAAVPDEKRTAHYVCHVALADPAGQIRGEHQARCRGRITRSARGGNGFGYDPYFLIPEYGRTFGELGAVVKQQISHRARAFQQFLPRLLQILRSAQTGG